MVKTILIPIGTNKISGRKVFFPLRPFGTNLVLAKSRYGKSAMIKDLACKVSNYRKVIVFDVNGEWSQNVTKYNWKSNNPSRFYNYRVINFFCFRISDFNTYSDWISLGFPPVGSRIMARLAAHPEIHNNDPEKFTKILADLPTTDPEENMFNAEYSKEDFHLIEGKVMDVTKASIRSRFSFVKSYFWKGKDDHRDIYNWEDVFSYKENLIINLNCKGEHEKAKAKAYVGKLLEILAPFLIKLKPVLIFEEADWLAPYGVGEDPERWPSSLSRLIEYSIKYQKYGVNLFYISQSEALIHSDITKHAHTSILGHVPRSDTNAALTKRLVWDIDRGRSGYREFILLHPSRRYDIFNPEESSCAV